MAEASRDVTRDLFLGGRLVLEQSSKGHRAGTDAVLLAAAAPRGFAGHVCDAGAGSGAVGLAIALTSPQARVTLIEQDPVSAALAERNIAANDLELRAAVVACDLLSPEARRAQLSKPADLVVTNPPFYRADQVRSSPDGQRRAAHVFPADGGVGDWLDACLSLLASKGGLIVIHRADALSELLRALDGKLGALTLLAVHPRAGRPATRVLVRGTKGSRAPLVIASPLVLHEGDTFTPESECIHTGSASLVW